MSHGVQRLGLGIGQPQAGGDPLGVFSDGDRERGEPSDRIRLQPENDALEPIYPEHVQILGRVTGVFRQL